MAINAVKANIEKVFLGDQLAGGRLIRLLEEGDPEGVAGLKAIFPHTGNAFVLGITGSAGFRQINAGDPYYNRIPRGKT